MKTFFITATFYITFLFSLPGFSQNAIITNSVLSELDYFHSFINKFLPYSTEHLYVIRIDSSHGGEFASDLKLYLVSVLYKFEILEYIQPKYAFFYANNWYVIKTDINIPEAQAVKLKDYTKVENDLRKFTNKIIKKQPLLGYNFLFPYCFFFKTSEGQVFGGMDIGSCDSYFGESDFFYNDADIERVEGVKH